MLHKTVTLNSKNHGFKYEQFIEDKTGNIVRRYQYPIKNGKIYYELSFNKGIAYIPVLGTHFKDDTLNYVFYNIFISEPLIKKIFFAYNKNLYCIPYEVFMTCSTVDDNENEFLRQRFLNIKKIYGYCISKG